MATLALAKQYRNLGYHVCALTDSMETTDLFPLHAVHAPVPSCGSLSSLSLQALSAEAFDLASRQLSESGTCEEAARILNK